MTKFIQAIALGLVFAALFLFAGVEDVRAETASLTRVNAPPVLLDNWEYCWTEEEGTGRTGVPLGGLEDWKSAGRLLNPQDRMGRSHLWLRVPLPSHKAADPSLLIRAFDNVEVYTEQGLAYRFGDWQEGRKHRYYGTPRRIVPLPDNTQGMLYIHLQSESRNIGIEDGAMYGSESGFIKQMVRQEFFRAVLGISYILAGIVAFCVFLGLRSHKVFLDFTLFSVCFGIYSICRSSVVYLVFDHPAILTYAELIALFGGVIGILMFVEHLLGSGRYAYVRRTWQLHLAYSAGVLLLHACRAISVVEIVDWYQLLLIVSMPLVIVRAAACAMKGNRGAKLLLIGIGVICLTGLIDIFQNRLNIIIRFSPMTYLGISVFILLLIVLLIRQFADIMLQLKRSEKLSLVGQMAAGMAHELRNPLTIISGFLQLSRKQAPDAPYLGMMSSEVHRMNEIIEDFLLLSKPVNSRFDRHEVLPLLRETLQLFDNQRKEAGVSAILEEEGAIPKIDCDPNQLKQVFINMVKNAIEAMPEGGLLHITAAALPKNKVRIRFADQGKGIEPGHLERIGEPFFTTKANGTGLGLMVSNKIIENHAGTLRVSSRPGLGTTIDIILPVHIKTA
ncbi:ATP-binding protein [Paenibacillus sp. UNC499MF]|uniref:ATP-binding protein n=1 Tax=Paenibacillus sp. UNC499MF TaxID=1502751 RepID=UPI0008A06FDA|nr:ATP-binding protein [Paenibacillus sp. UNC499MF]SEG55572.1 Signal transduction histidine kinase [Paenibacillus sp. UNC499MF]